MILKCAISVDGYLDDASPKRLILSNAEDLARADEVRASCDAILVGAGTIRADNPHLLIRSASLRDGRASRGLPPHPIRVTLTAGGDLDPSFHFFTNEEGGCLVYCPERVVNLVRKRLGGAAEIVSVGQERADMALMLRDLFARGVRRVLVEGGSRIGSAFLQAGLVDELQVSIAPFFVGDPRTPRFAGEGIYPHGSSSRMILSRVEQIGDMALITWLLRNGTVNDRAMLLRAIEISKSCVPSATAFSVGALIADSRGQIIAQGFSRERGPRLHAEEVALIKAREQGALLQGATVYSSLEPCGSRASSPVSCADLLIKHGIARVAYAMEEPSTFVRNPVGAQKLKSAGVEIIVMPDLAPMVRAVNAHLVSP